jgi:hypothetical protein
MNTVQLLKAQYGIWYKKNTVHNSDRLIENTKRTLKKVKVVH